MKIIKFTVFGKPVAKGRPKFGNGHAYTPEKTVNYEQLVKVSYLQTERIKFMGREQLKAELKIYFAIPRSAPNNLREMMINNVVRPTNRPDIDNIEKIIFDSLNGLAYKDDSQIVECNANKYYSDIPRVEIKLYEI